MRQFTLFFLFCVLAVSLSCRRAQTDFVTVALHDAFSTLDTLTTVASDSAAERVRNLLFNTMVRKDQNFDYVGELAKDIATSPDEMSLTALSQFTSAFTAVCRKVVSA